MKKQWNSLMRRVVRLLGAARYLQIEEVARRQNRFVYSPRVKWFNDRQWMAPYR